MHEPNVETKNREVYNELESYWVEVRGRWLPLAGVRKARMEEDDEKYHKYEVTELRSIEEYKEPREHVVDAKWFDKDKRSPEEQEPKYQLGARETKSRQEAGGDPAVGSSAEMFASMPKLEATKMQIGLFMSEKMKCTAVCHDDNVVCSADKDVKNTIHRHLRTDGRGWSANLNGSLLAELSGVRWYLSERKDYKVKIRFKIEAEIRDDESCIIMKWTVKLIDNQTLEIRAESRHAKEIIRDMNLTDAKGVHLPIEKEMSTEVVIQHRNQYMPNAMMGTNDSDFAGYQSLRRSTSMQWVRTASDVQGTVRCSSPESEYYDAVKTTSITMDNQPVLNNMDDEVGMEILSGASSGIVLVTRRGFGQNPIRC